MIGDQPNSNGRMPDERRRFIWQVIVISVIFLVVGLSVMYIYFWFRGRTIVGLETVDPLPAILPAEHVTPNHVRLLFTTDGATLSAEMRKIAPPDSPYERARSVIGFLLEGPRSRKFRSPIPGGVTVRGLYVTTGTAVLDLSAELREGLQGGASVEMLCVYSVVNTLLLNCPEFKTVTLLIEGRPVDTLLGYLDLGAPLVENLTLLSRDKASE